MNRTDGTTVVAFDSPAEAQAAINELKAAGFSEAEIGVVSHKRKGEHDDLFADVDDPTKADEGVAVGAAGGLLGGTLWGIGIAAGLLPAIGPVIAGGTLAAILASGATAAAAGGVVGGLMGMGIPEDDAKRYVKEFESGKTLVTVHAGNRNAEAERILGCSV